MVTLKSRTLVVAYLLLTIISSQAILSLHNIEHLGIYSHDDESDICEVCLIAKNLGQDFLVQTFASFSLTKSNQNTSSPFRHAANFTCNKPFQSQAPPHLFS